jgi:superfamily II DNA/RNA helicase
MATDFKKLADLTGYDDLSDDIDVNDDNANKDTGVDQRTHVPQNVHHASFNSLSLKPELIRAIDDNGFEQPSEGSQ